MNTLQVFVEHCLKFDQVRPEKPRISSTRSVIRIMQRSSNMDFALVLFALLLQHVYGGLEDKVYNEQVKNDYFKDGVELTKKNFQLKPNTNPAKNVILFLGDGMGISTTTAARIFDGQNRHESGEENVLSWEKFPYTALSKTYNTGSQVPDSAGTATAFAAGVKTNAGILGLNAKAVYNDCNSTKGNEVLSILTYAELAGMSTGLITNTRVTHATPGAFFSHSPSRQWENDQAAKGTCKDISRQLIEFPYGDGIEVAFGGGWRSFLPCGSIDPEGSTLTGSKCRSDSRNLTSEWLEKYNKSDVVWNKDQLKNIDPDKVDHLLGLFAASVMEYEVRRSEKNKTHQPSFVEMVEKAIEILSKNPKGFFLMAEGGLIDWGHHDNNAHLALSETVMMATAVKKAQKLTDAHDTLIIVTADHSHTFTQSGLRVKRGNPIFGFQTDLARDGKPVLSLSYADGAIGLTGNQTRANLTGVNYNDTNFRQQALVKMTYESHSAEDVGIYATGPFAHLFHGVVEQSYIFHVMDYALCLTKSKQEFCTKPPDRDGPAMSCSRIVTFNVCLLVISSLVSCSLF